MEDINLENQNDDILNVVAIGDPHFKVSNIIESEEFINKIIE